MRIVFMGTPQFAIPTLTSIYNGEHDLLAIVTSPDNLLAKNKDLICSPVKKFAIDNKITFLQPENLSDASFAEELKNFDADLFVVVAFKILPDSIWSIPKKGTINLHASLLPNYKGAAPINWAIINGEKMTGVTTFFINSGVDTGNILLQSEEIIYDTDDALTLSDRLMHKGADLVVETINKISQNLVTPTVQERSLLYKRAPKIFKEDCKIDWNQSSDKVFNFIRGLSPYPGAFTIWEGKILKIYSSQLFLDEDRYSIVPGECKIIYNKYIVYGTSDRPLSITSLQPEGRKVMDAQSFISGYIKC